MAAGLGRQPAWVAGGFTLRDSNSLVLVERGTRTTLGGGTASGLRDVGDDRGRWNLSGLLGHEDQPLAHERLDRAQNNRRRASAPGWTGSSTSPHIKAF